MRTTSILAMMRPLGFLLYALALGCRGNAGASDDQQMAAPEEHPEHHVAQAAEHSMTGMSAEDLHLKLTPLGAPSSADSARAAQLLRIMRRDLAKYADIRVAQADGFRQYIPGGAAPVQHYTKIRWAMQSRSGLNPARPTSLLYERTAAGDLRLVGAMFTAPPQTGDAELDARLPLSVVRWHQHINWCLPPLADARRRWNETRDGRPVFGPKSPIVTAEACAAVGGRFRARLFGWMVHVMFSDEQPWNADHH